MSNGKEVSIPEFFAEKNVFITGGHGFIGKAFTEKVLRSCGNVGKVYWLVREKRGMKQEERLRKTLNDPIFDKLREENPEALDKIKVMPGDIQYENLGLSEENLKILIDQVHIVVHSAATIKFTEPLAVAIRLNVKGTREISQIALKMKNLQAFCYVSTLYSQQDKRVVEEKFYPASADWRQAIEIADNFDQDQLNILSPKFIGANPNTYTFSKSLAEHCVKDVCEGKVPLVVFRPGIVISTYQDPLPGWTNSLTGPVGIYYGFIEGAIKTMNLDGDVKQDHIPVDYIVKGMISSIYKKGLESSPLKEVSYYNGRYNSVSYNQLLNMLDEVLSKTRTKINFYPSFYFNKNYTIHILAFYFLQLLPAVIIDLTHKIFIKTPQKLSMLQLQKQVFINTSIYAHFSLNEWNFINKKFMGLLTGVKEEDFEEFGVMDEEHPCLNCEYDINSYHYLHSKILGRKLLDKPAGEKSIRRLKLLKTILICVFYVLVGFCCYQFFY